MPRFFRTVASALILLGLSTPAFAQLGSVPYTFTPGTTIVSAEVNAMFSAIYSGALNRTGGTMTGTLTSQQITPASSATYDLGASGTVFRSIYLGTSAVFSSGGVITFNSGDVTVTHSTNTLAFAGAASGYTFDAPVAVSTDTYPPIRATRTGFGSSTTIGALDVRVTHTSSMGDGFGPIITFTVRDTDATDNPIGALGFVRTGADNIGDFLVQPINAGASTTRLRLTNAGNMALGATARFYLDGTAATGNTYLVESSSDTLDIVAGGTTSFSTTATVTTFATGVVGTGATGGGKGAGTANFTAVYDDNVLLSDWVFEQANGIQKPVRGGEGEQPEQPTRVKGPNMEKRLYALSEVDAITGTENRLPWMPSADTFEAERHTGGMITRLWVGQEQQQLYISSLNKQIEALTAEVAALKARLQ